MTLELKYLSHSAFEIKKNGTAENSKILIDPFLGQNPTADYNWRSENISEIFVTHGHGDHLGDAIEISKSKGAKIVCIFELANYCQQKGAIAEGAGIGGTVKFSIGKVSLVSALHSSSTPEGGYAGLAVGFVFEIDGVRIYHAGDTGLSSEMKVIGDFYKPDVALLPIGGYFTMGVREAVKAAEFLGAKTVIPMHYNTFPAINADLNEFSACISKLGLNPVILKTGESIAL